MGGGVKGGRERCRGNHGREGWVGDIYGGDEGRRNIREREGWFWEIYEAGFGRRDMRGGWLFIDVCKYTVHRIE